MKLHFLDAHTDREQIREIWNELTSELEVDYFLSPGWVETWLDSLPREVALKLVVGYLDGSPVLAFFAGIRGLWRKRVIPVRSVFVNATGVPEIDRLSIEYNQVLMKGTPPERIWDVLEELDRTESWDEFVFPGHAVDAVADSLISRCPPRWRPVVVRDDPSPYVNLEAVREKEGDYASLLSSNTRRQMRRCYEAYSKNGAIECEVAANADRALEMFDELVELHRERWDHRGVEGAFSRQYSLSFHTALIRNRFDSGEIQLLRVTAGDHTVGCLYNFVFNGRVLFYQGGLVYSEDGKMKPGWLCHAEAVRFNAKSNLKAYDFLAGGGQYKRSLSTDRNRLIWAKVQKRKLRFELELIGAGLKRRYRKTRSILDN